MIGKLEGTEEKREFRPFTINLTVQTVEEARLLYHIFNNNSLLEHLKAVRGHLPNGKIAYNFTDYLPDIAPQLNCRVWADIREELARQDFLI